MSSNAASTSSPSPSSSSPATTSSPCGKRTRDPEDEVYVDNLHSHKRYLSEIMASSLNGLTVGDSLQENMMESPARSEGMFYTSFRDDMSLQYSPMSEDSDDSRYCEGSGNSGSFQSDSLPTSPVSPYRYQRPLSAFSSLTPSTPVASHAGNFPAVSSPQPRARGSSDSEGRFPSSPSDICHSADLRRAALLRSVQIRTQESVSNAEADERSCLYMKSLGDDREYSRMVDYVSEFDREKSCAESDTDRKGDESEV